MLYIKIIHDDKDNDDNDDNDTDNIGDILTYSCRQCGETEKVNNITVIKEVTIDNTVNIPFNISPDIKLDNTIPRDKNMKCVDEECESHKSGNHDVLYYRFDDVNMKYLYMCCVCDKTWQ